MRLLRYITFTVANVTVLQLLCRVEFELFILDVIPHSLVDLHTPRLPLLIDHVYVWLRLPRWLLVPATALWTLPCVDSPMTLPVG